MGAVVNIQKPPQAVEIEQSVLAAGLLGAATELVYELDEGDFYTFKHRLIFKTMLELCKANIPVELVTVVEHLRDTGNLSRAGGAAYIAELIDNIPASTSLHGHIEILRKKRNLRRLLTVCEQTIKRCQVGREGYDDIMDAAQAGIMEATATATTAQFVTYEQLAETMPEQWEDLDRMPPALKTGFYRVDQHMGGLYPTDLIVLAARPGMGKTAMAINIARHVAGQGNPVLFFSLEMSAEQLFARQAAAEAAVDSHKLRCGGISKTEWEKIIDALERLHKLPIYVDETSIMHYRELQRRIRFGVQQHGVKAVIIDYLQYIRGDGDNQAQRVGSVSKAMKAIAKECKIPVLLLSQLNRNLEQREDKRPRLSDLKESGSIEEDADVVMFLYRDAYYNPGSNEHEAELEIAKHRHGRSKATIPLTWIGWRSMFEDAE